MTLKNVVLSVILIGLVFSVFFYFLSDMTSSYQIEINETDVASMSQMNQTLDAGNQIAIDMEEAKEEMGRSEWFEGVSTYGASTYKVIKLPVNAMSSVYNMTGEIGSRVGIPPFALLGITTMIVVTILFLILNYFTRWKDN